MTELIDSIVVESHPKRVPKSKSGRLLCAVRDKIIGDMKAEVKEQKFHVPTFRVESVKQLNRRIKGRLLREDLKQKNNSQLAMINSFSFRIIPEGKKRSKPVRVETSTLRQAKKIIRMFHGSKTKFL